MNTSYLEMVATSCKGWTSCYFIEPVSDYLSGPSLYVEWTNWSKIVASYSDKYTSHGSLLFINQSYLERVAAPVKRWNFGIC